MHYTEMETPYRLWAHDTHSHITWAQSCDRDTVETMRTPLGQNLQSISIGAKRVVSGAAALTIPTDKLFAS